MAMNIQMEPLYPYMYFYMVLFIFSPSQNEIWNVCLTLTYPLLGLKGSSDLKINYGSYQSNLTSP